MYIRARVKRLKNGTTSVGYALQESRRVEGVPRQFTLLNLGMDFAIPQEQWAALTTEVEARLKGEPQLPLEEEPNEAFQRAVHDLVEKLLAINYDIRKRTKQRHLIDLDEVTHPDSRTVGGERFLVQALQKMKFPELLQDLGFSPRQVKLACAMVIGRALSPGSERHTHDWMCNESSILEILKLDPPSPRTLHRCAARLNEHSDQIMERLYGNTQQMLEFDETILFYDLTNTFYHGQQKGELLRYGRSKQKRNDCPLVTAAMTMSACGLPRQVRVLPGNASEPGTLEETITKLHLGKERVTIVMDAGIATKKNLAYLQEQELDWITLARTNAPPVPTRTPDETFQTTGEVEIRAWELSREERGLSEEEGSEEEERFLYIHSAARQKTEEQILERSCAEFEARLTALHEGLSKPRCLKSYPKVLVKIGRLMQTYAGVSHLYEIHVQAPAEDDKKQHAQSITFTKLAAHTDRVQAVGGYVIRTNRMDWTVEQVARRYWRLTEIESVFRAMKSDLGMRPIYHRNDEQIEAHLFISVLAYSMVQVTRYSLKGQGVHQSWATVRARLNRIRRITTRLPKNRYRYLIHVCDQDLTPYLLEIFACLNFRYDPKETKTWQEYVTEPAEPKKPPDP